LKKRDYENKCKGYYKNHFSVLFLYGTFFSANLKSLVEKRVDGKPNLAIAREGLKIFNI
jgi:hypothetical protein